MQKLDQVSIRKQNLYYLWNVIRNCPGITRRELANRTGMSLMTVTNLVDCLEDHCALSFNRQETPSAGYSGAGRKADSISLNDDNHAWVMLDLTDMRFRYVALTLNVKTICASQPFAYDAKRGYEENFFEFLNESKGYIGQLLESRELIGIAVSVPGPYDVLSDVVNNMRIPQINSLRLKEILRSHIGAYRYCIDEDVKFALRAYTPVDDAREDGLLYYIYIGEGVGGAAAMGDTVLRGLNAVTGDGGQMLREREETWENAISLRAFAAMLGFAGWEDAVQDVLMEAIMRCAINDPSAYQQALARMASRVARMLYNILWVLDPSKIVIDCPYAAWAADDFMNGVRAGLESLTSGRLPRLPVCVYAPVAVPAILVGAMKEIGKGWIGQFVTKSHE